MADLLEPQKRLIAGLNGQTSVPKPQPAPKPAAAQKAPKAPEYEPLPIQPDEHTEYMAKQLAKIASKINSKGQEVMKTRLMKTGTTKSSPKR